LKQVLITGGAGFIGSHLTELLLTGGNHVTVLDDESTGSPDNLAAVQDHFQFEYVAGDVADGDLLDRLLKGVDEVYHLAAAVGVRMVADAPVESIERNVLPTQRLLERLLQFAGTGRPPKLFFASSSEVYGKNPKQRWSEEDSLLMGPTTRPRWSYGVAKALDEFLVLAYYRQHKLPVVVGRLFNVVGPRQSGRYGMVLPRFVERALAGEPPVVYDDGAQVRCFAHVGDVCRAAADLMRTDAAVGKVINIGSDEPITILELAEAVVRLVDPKLDIEFQSYRHVYAADFEDIRRRVPDLQLLRSLIHYEPRYATTSTVEEVVEWMRSTLG